MDGIVAIGSDRDTRTVVRPWPQSAAEFETLVEEVQHWLVRFAFGRLGSLADAEDVVQEVLVRAYRDREKLQHVDNVYPFLFRMTANRVTDLLRQRKRRAAPLDTGPTTAAPEAADGASQMRRLQWVQTMLERLPRRQSEVIRLRIDGNLPFEAVAEALGCPVPTVKSRFRYGIQKLRKLLEKEGGER